MSMDRWPRRPKRFANDCWVSAEFSLPQSVIHDEHWRSAGVSVSLCETTTQQWRHTEELKGIRGHKCPTSFPQSLAVIVQDVQVVGSNDLFENVILSSTIDELWDDKRFEVTVN